MIIRDIIYLFFTITFWLTVAKGQENCSFWSKDKRGNSRMPLVYKLDDQQMKGTLLYPDEGEHLLVEHNTILVMSCLTSTFVKEAINDTNEIYVTCKGGNRVTYRYKTYFYYEFECQHVPRSTMVVTGRVCHPNNNTVIQVGFQTRNLFFQQYTVCYDTIKKNTLYTWFTPRMPFYDHYQHRPRMRFFHKDEDLFENFDIENAYSKYKQQETLNAILKLNPHSERYLNNNTSFLTRGHYASKTDFYFAREQAGTFNYVNVAPQWRQVNSQWTEVEIAVKRGLAMHSHNRRVLVTGSYGTSTLPDKDGVPRPLYLVMPGNCVAVPMFVFKLVHDVDEPRNSIVYVGLNNPFVDHETVERERLKCHRVACPMHDRVVNNSMLHCCTAESFERAYGHFDPVVLRPSPPIGLIVP